MTITAATTFAQAQAAFSDALEATKAELIRVNREIDAKGLERSSIVNKLPHAEDIAASLVLGLRHATDDYERQFGNHLVETYTTGYKSAEAVRRSASDFLTIGARPSDNIERRNAIGIAPEKPLAFNAVAYFLRDKIEAEIPALVIKLCPTSQTGMKGADRRAALQVVDAALASLTAERDQLEADIAAARKVVGQR